MDTISLCLTVLDVLNSLWLIILIISLISFVIRNRQRPRTNRDHLYQHHQTVSVGIISLNAGRSVTDISSSSDNSNDYLQTPSNERTRLLQTYNHHGGRGVINGDDNDVRSNRSATTAASIAASLCCIGMNDHSLKRYASIGFILIVLSLIFLIAFDSHQGDYSYGLLDELTLSNGIVIMCLYGLVALSDVLSKMKPGEEGARILQFIRCSCIGAKARILIFVIVPLLIVSLAVVISVMIIGISCSNLNSVEIKLVLFLFMSALCCLVYTISMSRLCFAPKRSSQALITLNIIFCITTYTLSALGALWLVSYDSDFNDEAESKDKCKGFSLKQTTIATLVTMILLSSIISGLGLMCKIERCFESRAAYIHHYQGSTNVKSQYDPLPKYSIVSRADYVTDTEEEEEEDEDDDGKSDG